MRFSKPKRLSLKMLFIYAFVFVIIITITIISLTNYFRWKDYSHSKARDVGLTLTRTLAQGCEQPFIENDSFRLKEYAKKLIKDEDMYIAYVTIMNNERVLAQMPDNLGEVPQEINKRIKDNENDYLIQTYYNTTLNADINDISVPVLIEDRKWGTVRVGFSLEHIRKEIYRNTFAIMARGLISIGIGIVVALILSSLVAGPVEKLVKRMEEVEKGGLDQKIGDGKTENGKINIFTSNEFVRMNNSFRNMTNSLKENKKELENTLNRLGQKEKMAALGVLIARVAHDIKTPLGIIKSAAQIQVDETKDPEDKIKVAPSIIQGVNQIDSMIQDLLYYAKPEQPILRKVYLNNILEKKIQLWESQGLEDQKIRITRKFNRDIPQLLLDEDQIGEITFNMIRNAYEAMPDGGEIIISTDWDLHRDINKSIGRENPVKLNRQAFVKIEFEDHGIGISKENQKEIFDPFFTTKEKGTGLGLYSVYNRVEGIKGRIDVKSEEGKGTKFTILLPVSRNGEDTWIPSEF